MELVGTILKVGSVMALLGGLFTSAMWVAYIFTFNPLKTRFRNWAAVGAVLGALVGTGVAFNERGGYRDYSPAASSGGISNYDFKRATGISREEMEDRVRRRDRN